MSENDEKIEIQIEDALEVEPVVVEEPEHQVADEQIASDDDDEEQVGNLTPEEALKKLKKQLQKEKQGRADAERLARDAQAHVAKAYTEVDDTNLQLVSTAIDNLERDLDTMTASYAEAMQSGEYDRAAKIQRAMTSSETKLEQLKYGFEEMKKGPPKRALPEVPQPTHRDVLDQIIGSVTPASADWLRANKGYIRDQNDIQDMFTAHNSAVQRGIQADTPEYFSFIERRLGIERQSIEEEVMSSASKPAARKAAPPAAPVNRGGNPRNAATLTKAEAEMAQALGMSHKDYWTHQQALKKEGKLQ
jgi:hypothetical protein